jgi:hypothetical protein
MIRYGLIGSRQAFLSLPVWFRMMHLPAVVEVAAFVAAANRTPLDRTSVCTYRLCLPWCRLVSHRQAAARLAWEKPWRDTGLGLCD